MAAEIGWKIETLQPKKEGRRMKFCCIRIYMRKKLKYVYALGSYLNIVIGLFNHPFTILPL